MQADGKFTVDEVPTGEYSVMAFREGFAHGAFGAEIPGQPGTLLRLAPVF